MMQAELIERGILISAAIWMLVESVTHQQIPYLICNGAARQFGAWQHKK
jgi:hypothetical protein